MKVTTVRVCIGALLLASTALAQNADTGGVPTEYVLVSWHGPPDCVHVLLSKRQYMAIVTHQHLALDDYPERHLLGNASKLEAAIARLPEHSSIAWRDYFPADTAYPPPRIIERIKAFAAARNISVQIIPGQPKP